MTFTIRIIDLEPPFFYKKCQFSVILGPKRRSIGLLRAQTILKSIEKLQGIYVSPLKLINIIYSSSYWPESTIFEDMTSIFSHFGPEMKVHRSVEVRGCIEIYRKVRRDIQYVNEIISYHLKSELLTLSRRFWQKIPIFSHFWPEMKVHRSNEKPQCTEIHIKAIKDI